MERIWQAKWITDRTFAPLEPVNVFHKELEPLEYEPDEALANSHILFRQRVALKRCDVATLYISADDYYKLYINGAFVDQGPAPGNPAHYYYNTIDVTRFLRPGENIVAVHTYYQGQINRVWVSGDARHGLIAELVVDGRTVLATDESWRVARHTGYSSLGLVGYKTQYREKYDSGAPEVGFEAVDFDDSGWETAHAREHLDYALFAQPIRQLTIYRKKPVCVKWLGENGLWIDFGRAYVGYFEARAQGVRGSEIAVRTGMELLENGRVRYDTRSNCLYDERWVLSGRPEPHQLTLF